jgi:conjugal transfer ATP-binding protein TraC
MLAPYDDKVNHLRSYDLQTLESYFKYYRIGPFLPYSSFDKHKRLFVNRNNLGFVLEILPIIGCSESTQQQLSGVFQYILPEETNIQFLLYADPYVGNRLDNWVAARGVHTDILQEISANRSAYLRGIAHEGRDGINVRNFRSLISVTRNLDTRRASKSTCDYDIAAREMQDIRERLLETLTMIGAPAIQLGPDDLISTIEDWLSPNLISQNFRASQLEWNPYDPINEQIPKSTTSIMVQKDGIYLNEGTTVIRSYGVRKYPRFWAQSIMGDLLGDPMRELLQIPAPFMIHYGVHVPKQEKLQMKFMTKSNHVDRQAGSPLAKYLPEVIEEAKENQFVRQELASNHRFVQTNFTVMLMAPHQRIARCEQALLNLYRTKGWDIKRNDYLHMQSLMISLPMTWGDAAITDLATSKGLKTTLSTEAGNLLPIQGEWCGTSSEGMLLTGRRGQLFSWFPYDNNAGNYNVSVVGRSGSGKSVFMQELMTTILGAGGRVFVLDVGRSFQKACHLLGGQFIEFTTKNPINVNPFSSISGADTEEEAEAQNSLSLLKSVICTMAAPTEGTTDQQSAFIEQALLSTWQHKGRQASITDVSDTLLKHKSEVAVSLGQMLLPYTKDGMYGKFFEGPATVDFCKSLVVVELEELKERKDLQSVIVQMIIINITNQMFLGDRLTPFMIVFDEAWDLLRGKQSAAFVETLARRLRKYNGSLVVGTQSVNDFYASPGGLAAFENSDWLCLLSQKPESIAMLRESKRIIMTDALEESLNSVHTSQGAFAEVMIIGPHGHAIGRLLLDPFSRILYSTKAEEYAAVQKLVDKGVELTTAVREIAASTFKEDWQWTQKHLEP